MKIEYHLLRQMDIREFAERHNLTLEVHEREPRLIKLIRAHRYYVHFTGVEVTDGIVLSSITGNGHTMDDAIHDYVEQISSKQLVKDALRPSRVEFPITILTYDPAY